MAVFESEAKKLIEEIIDLIIYRYFGENLARNDEKTISAKLIYEIN